MKIIYTTHQFLPEYASGTENLTCSTAREMQKRGHEVFILTGFPPRGEKGAARFSDRYEYNGLTVDRFFCSQSPPWIQNRMEAEFHDPFFSRYFRERLEQIRPDIVHFYHLQRLSAEAIDVCGRLGIPTVFTATDFWLLCPTNQLLYANGSICDGPGKDSENCVRHLAALSQGPLVSSIIGKMPSPVLRSLIQCTGIFPLSETRYAAFVQSILTRQANMKRLISGVDRVLAATRFMGDKFLEFGLKENRISQLTFGIELGDGNLQPVKKGNGKNFTVGFIGTLYFHKGADILLKAVRQTPADLPVSVKIYGSLEQFPQYVEQLKAIAGNDRRMEFCGTFPQNRIGEILEDLDILVVPSLWHENSPLVIHVAQAAGVPVVGSNTGGVNEIIQDGLNGLLFERGDAEGLSRIIQTLCDDRELVKRLSGNAQKPKTIVSYVDELEQVYRNVGN